MISKKTLFPNGYPAPPPPDPTPEEQIILRERLEMRLLSILPGEFSRHLSMDSHEIHTFQVSPPLSY